jgi:hypothetical protein
MSLTLIEVADLFRTVVREQKIDANVIGVTSGEGDGSYAEVFVDLPSSDRRISVGLVRNRGVDHLRRQIAERLVAGM